MTKSVKWNRNIDFLFACAGGAIGLGNVWRFPYVCFANGGGAFLIPYLIVAACVGMPVFFLESCLGQLTGSDMVKVWKLVPMFRAVYLGIGYAQLVMSCFANAYFNVVLAWLARYLVASFRSVLPWTLCDRDWNTKNCVISDVVNTTMANNTSVASVSNHSATTPIEEFWENQVLQISANVENIGSLNWELTGCLVVLWIIVYFCIWRGVKWTSKVVYFTVPFPFILLFVVLIRGVTLEGASLGVRYYLKPNLSAILNPQVWVKAVEQVCYSFTVGWGIIATLASHNKFDNNFYRHTIAIVCLNIFTSFVSGFAVFSVLGYMATLQNVTVASVAKSGPGLAFIAYPKALTFLPLPQLWSVLFFTMMLFLSLDSLFVALECITLTIYNQLPKSIRRRKFSYEIFGAVLIVLFCLVSLSMVTNGGYYVFRIFEFGSSGWCLIFSAFFESIAVGWVIGADRFLSYASKMLQQKPVCSFFLKLCWKFIIPIATPILAVLSLRSTYAIYYDDQSLYPSWALAIGWIMIFSSLLWIPICVISTYRSSPGSSLQKLKKMVRTDESSCLFNQKKPECWTEEK